MNLTGYQMYNLFFYTLFYRTYLSNLLVVITALGRDSATSTYCNTRRSPLAGACLLIIFENNVF